LHVYSGQGVAAEGPIDEADWQIRPYQEGDIPAIAALWNAAAQADGLDFVLTEETWRVDFARPGFDPFKFVIVVEEPRPEGLPADMAPGFGSLTVIENTEDNERVYMPTVCAHPSARPLGLERIIAGRLMSMVRDEEQNPIRKRVNKVLVRTAIRDEQVSLRTLYEGMGLRHYRTTWTMFCLLDHLEEPTAIEGVNIRNYRLPEDNKRALEAYNNSFADMYQHHPRTQEEWDFGISAGLRRPDLSWLAEIDDEPGKIAGFCICVIFEESNKALGRREGWIDLLGTIRGWRGKGLGRSLLLHGMHSLKAAGMDTALLGVDSESPTGAQRLYESCGFRVRSVGLRYIVDLADVNI
jgi:mycothiol synthase